VRDTLLTPVPFHVLIQVYRERHVKRFELVELSADLLGHRLPQRQRLHLFFRHDCPAWTLSELEGSPRNETWPRSGRPFEGEARLCCRHLCARPNKRCRSADVNRPPITTGLVVGGEPRSGASLKKRYR
jgi:hypothetical protein